MSAAPVTFIDLDDESGLDADRCGSKAATLARLRRAGFTTPPGFVLPTNLLQGLVDVPSLAAATAAEARARFGDRSLAIRSSARGEDGVEASFAGLFMTLLGVSGVDAIEQALRACLAASIAAPVQTYRGGQPSALAILVQPMLDPEAAGVAFTADPVTGDRDITRVSAVRGLGDRLVSGTANPDEWDIRLGGARRRPEAGEDAIDGATATAVADLARSIADRLNASQDVEWALAQGELTVLQSRPITALPVAPPPLDGEGWSKDTAHYPEPVSPFGGDVIARISDVVMPDTCEHFGLLIDGFENRVVGGEMYSRPLGGGDGKPPPAIVLGVLARVIPSLRRKMAAASRVVDGGLLQAYPDRWDAGWRGQQLAAIERYLDIDLEAFTNGALAEHGEELERFYLEGIRIHFRLALPYFVALYEWCAAAEEHLGWDTSRSVSVLAGDSPASVRGGQDMAVLRARVDAVPGAGDALVARPASPIEALRSVDPELAEEMARWVRTHGWRTVSYDPGGPTLAERPGLLTRLLLGTEGVKAPAPSVLSAAIGPLAPRQREHVLRMLAFARRCYPQREDNIVLTDNLPAGLLRRWLLECGRRLVAEGRIDRVADIPYLLAGEIRTALAGSESELRAIIARRRGEWAWTRAHPGPMRIGPADGGLPNLSRLPAAGRRMNSALLWAMGHEFPSEAAGPVAAGGELRGAPGSPGTYRGTACIVLGERDFARLQPGDVLVCPVTTPAWAILFPLAGALVTDGGGVLSHAAIVAREHGIPAVLGTGSATRMIKDGTAVEVDGTRGSVVIAG